MPHVVIEYADEPALAPRIDGALDAIVGLIDASPVIELSNLKARAVAYKQYRVEGRSDPFVHTSIAIMGGHEAASLEGLTAEIFTLLSRHFPEIWQVTVELREMNPATYRKRQRNAEAGR